MRDRKTDCLYFQQTRFPLLDRCIRDDDFSGLEEQLRYTMWTGVPTPGAQLPLDDDGLACMIQQASALRESTDRAKELAGVKVMLHSCGGIEPLLEDLIEAGLDPTDPVQITCRDMEAHLLKAGYGDRPCFCGCGCDTREVLPSGTPGDVDRHVREQIEILSPGGGFVFQQVHNIMAKVPPENALAMFRRVKP